MVRIRNDKSIQRQLFQYAFPSIIGMLIVGIQTFVDGIFVSKGVGAIGLAAINLSMPLISVMLSVSIMIISGGVVVAGIAKGQGDEEKAKGYTTLTFLVLVTTMLLFSLILLLNLKKTCYFLGSNDAVYPYVRQYLGIIGGAFVFYCIPNFTEAFTRFAGKPNWVFISGTICCVVNIVLDYFFVIRFGWGVAGAAVATCIANSSAALVLAHHVRMGRLVGNWALVGKIFYNGSSEMLTSVSAAITTFIFNLVLMSETGPVGVAALTIVFYINFAVNMSIFGLSQALYPLMSYALGAKDYRQIKLLLFNALLFSAAIGYSIYFLALIFKKPIITLFANGDAELMQITRTAMTYITLHYLISFFNIIASSFHTAIARPLESAVIALCRSILFVLLPLAILWPRIGALSVWLSMPIAEALTLLVSVPLVIYSMKKLKKRIVATS